MPYRHCQYDLTNVDMLLKFMNFSVHVALPAHLYVRERDPSEIGPLADYIPVLFPTTF